MAETSSEEPGKDTSEQASDGTTNASPLVGLLPGHRESDGNDGRAEQDTHEALCSTCQTRKS